MRVEVITGLCFVIHTTTLFGGFLSTVRMNMRFDMNSDANVHSSSILPRLSVGIINVITPLSASSRAALLMSVEKGSEVVCRAMLRFSSGHGALFSKNGGLHVMLSNVSVVIKSARSACMMSILLANGDAATLDCACNTASWSMSIPVIRASG